MVEQQQEETEQDQLSTVTPTAAVESRGSAIGQGQPSDNNNNNNNDTNGGPYRKWLYDRIYGKSKYATNHPPCFVCYVPRPVGWFPMLLEENRLCQIQGSIGIPDDSKETGRYYLLRLGFTMNVIALILTSISIVALSNNFNIIQAFSLSHCDVVERSNLIPKFSLDIALRNVAVDYSNLLDTNAFVTNYTDPTLVLPFHEFCYIAARDSNLRLFIEPIQCDSCNRVSQHMIANLFLSILTFLPTITSDTTRWYSNYDVNCQKGLTTILALTSFIASMLACINYTNKCFGSFNNGYIPFARNGTALDPNTVHEKDIQYVFELRWSMGYGLIFLYSGTILKLIDIVCNCLIRTPSITRNIKEQEQYEKIA